jgi:hypothetical protein
MTTWADLAKEADDLARVAKRLPTDNYRISQEIVEIARSDLAHALHCLAGKIRKLARAEDEPPPAKPERGKFEPGVVAANGRIVRVEVRNKVR